MLSSIIASEAENFMSLSNILFLKILSTIVILTITYHWSKVTLTYQFI